VVLWAGPVCASVSKVAPPAVLMNNVNFHNYQMQILSHLILNMDLFVFVIFEFLSVVTMMNIVPKDVLPHSQVEIK